MPSLENPSTQNGSARAISSFIACAHLPLRNAHVDTKVLKFGLSLNLHPYFVYVNSEGSGESAHTCIIACIHVCADSLSLYCLLLRVLPTH